MENFSKKLEMMKNIDQINKDFILLKSKIDIISNAFKDAFKKGKMEKPVFLYRMPEIRNGYCFTTILN
jgi:hypothetical protein